ncbi:MAG: hypothetical protein ACI4T1_04560 [Christensenellales bacterium]
MDDTLNSTDLHILTCFKIYHLMKLGEKRGIVHDIKSLQDFIRARSEKCSRETRDPEKRAYYVNIHEQAIRYSNAFSSYDVLKSFVMGVLNESEIQRIEEAVKTQ